MADLFRHIFLIVLIGYLTACNNSDPLPEPPEPPIEEAIYFESIGNTLVYEGKDLIVKAFDLKPGESLPITAPNLQVKVEEVKYYTVDPLGNKIIASGIISYPATGEFEHIVLAEHFTISSDEEAPSTRMCSMETAFSLFKCLVISPDYIGFGVTKNLTHPYLHVENTAQVSIDLLFAVKEYMAMKEKPLSKSIYISGYSQGGAAALAVHKMIEEKYASDITIRHTMAGGGPYNLTGIFNDFTEKDHADYPCSIPMTIIGMDYGDNLKLDYSKVFKEPLLSNYNEWINSKKYTTGQINSMLGSNTISTYIHSDMFSGEKNSEFNKLYTSLEKNSLINWTPKAPISLVHGKKDEVVPYFCSQDAYDSFTQKGTNVQLFPVDSDHKGTATSFYLLVLQKLLL